MCRAQVGDKVRSVENPRVKGQVIRTSCGGTTSLVVVRTNRGRVDECKGAAFKARWDELHLCANCDGELTFHGDMWHCPGCGNEWASA